MRRLDPAARVLAAIALTTGSAAAWHYHLQHLTLRHYDAKAHLVVARRIIDSLTPGWEQIGAVWLPLPHLLQALPVQVDWFYRTGAFAVACSVVASAVAATALFEMVRVLTGSRAAGGAGAAIFMLNPNVLYLQSTPMTEPLLFALITVEALLVARWVTSVPSVPSGAAASSASSAASVPFAAPASSAASVRSAASAASVASVRSAASVARLEVPHAAGWVMVLACLTRYEAWPVTAAIWALAALALWRRGHAVAAVVPVMIRLAVYPLAALLAFLCLSRLTVGAWFVSGGFFVPDPALAGHPGVVLDVMAEGTAALGGPFFVKAAVVSGLAVAGIAAWQRHKVTLLVPLGLAAAGLLPFLAFLAGHPFRIRYEVPLILAGSVAIGLAVGQFRRLAPFAAVLAAGLVIADLHPLDPQAPMVREAQLDGNVDGRRLVTACLVSAYDGTTIMASMGSLAHYMQELSAEGFVLADFLHEGNGPLWDSAFTRGPAPMAGWVLVEERAEGGDALFKRQQRFPHFLDGFTRVCEGGHVALYRRTRGTRVPREAAP